MNICIWFPLDIFNSVFVSASLICFRKLCPCTKLMGRFEQNVQNSKFNIVFVNTCMTWDAITRGAHFSIFSSEARVHVNKHGIILTQRC